MINEPSQPNAKQALTRTDPTTCWRGLGSITQWSKDITGCEVERDWIREYLIKKQTKDKENSNTAKIIQRQNWPPRLYDSFILHNDNTQSLPERVSKNSCLNVMNLFFLLTLFRCVWILLIYWKLKIYYRKYCNKIIFKGVNNIMRSKNTLVWVFLCFWLGHEQCCGI